MADNLPLDVIVAAVRLCVTAERHVFTLPSRLAFWLKRHLQVVWNYNGINRMRASCCFTPKTADVKNDAPVTSFDPHDKNLKSFHHHLFIWCQLCFLSHFQYNSAVVLFCSRYRRVQCAVIVITFHNISFRSAMETKCKTMPARRAGKSKKLPARGKTCLPDLAEKCWYII